MLLPWLKLGPTVPPISHADIHGHGLPAAVRVLRGLFHRDCVFAEGSVHGWEDSEPPPPRPRPRLSQNVPAESRQVPPVSEMSASRTRAGPRRRVQSTFTSFPRA